MKRKNNNSNRNFSSEELNLLEIINSSYLTIEDLKWLKNKWWFKRFIRLYSKELIKRYGNEIKNNKSIKKESSVSDDNIEVLDFTQSISAPSKEIIEVLDFTKTIDVTNIKDVKDASLKAKNKIRLEKMVLRCLIVISIFIFIVLSSKLIKWNVENKDTNDMVEEIYEITEVKSVKPIFNEIKIPSSTNSTNDGNKKSDLYDYSDIDMIEVDFSKLLVINKDTVGWIKVFGTKINYPIVQSGDNEYYLKHSFDKTENKKGWIFLDFRNDINNLSKNNILYSHGLNNGQLFGSMRKVFNKNWYNDSNNHFISISTPNYNQLWQIFSIYTIDPETYYITTEFQNNGFFLQFANELTSRSMFDFNTEIYPEDKVLTLSSCYNNEKRMVMHAKLISIQIR